MNIIKLIWVSVSFPVLLYPVNSVCFSKNGTHSNIFFPIHFIFLLNYFNASVSLIKVEVMKVGILKVLRLAVKFNKVWTFNIKKNRFDFCYHVYLREQKPEKRRKLENTLERSKL